MVRQIYCHVAVAAGMYKARMEMKLNKNSFSANILASQTQGCFRTLLFSALDNYGNGTINDTAPSFSCND